MSREFCYKYSGYRSSVAGLDGTSCSTCITSTGVPPSQNGYSVVQSTAGDNWEISGISFTVASVTYDDYAAITTGYVSNTSRDGEYITGFDNWSDKQDA